MIPWTYKNKHVVSIPENAKAFVYYLEFEDQTKYIGKKNLYSTRRKRIVGKTKRKVTISESNWKSYLSSSSEVKQKIKAGDKLIKREILRWCYSVGEASYWEAFEQFTRHVLMSADWLNKWISVRIYKQKIKEEDHTDHTIKIRG